MTQIKRIFTDVIPVKLVLEGSNRGTGIQYKEIDSCLKQERRLCQCVSSVFYFTLISICILVLAGSSFSQSEPPPRITVTPKQVDLGIVKKDEVMLYKVIVGNKGKGNLYITNIPAPNENTGISLSKNAIKPGKKIELTFFYRATNIGKINEHVFINSNDPKTPSVKIILKGEVR